MNAKNSYSVRKRGLALFLLAAFEAGAVLAVGNVDATDKYAWSENGGWQNWNSPNGGGVTVDTANGCLSGYVWGENIGWVKLGAGGPYLNDAADNYGVNMNSAGELSGYAWSETCGWINFHPGDSQVTIDKATGSFDGYAWAENIGWIHFKNVGSPVYNVKTTARFGSGALIIIR